MAKFMEAVRMTARYGISQGAAQARRLQREAEKAYPTVTKATAATRALAAAHAEAAAVYERHLAVFDEDFPREHGDGREGRDGR